MLNDWLVYAISQISHLFIWLILQKTMYVNTIDYLLGAIGRLCYLINMIYNTNGLL